MLQGFGRCALTASKRPVLLHGETQYCVSSGVAEASNDSIKGNLTLTSHHLFWVDVPRYQNPCKLALAAVKSIDAHGTSGFSRFIKRTPKLEVELVSGASLVLEFTGGKDAGTSLGDFEDMMNQALERKSWKVEKKDERSAQERFTTSRAGIGGVIRHQKQKREQASELAKEAFADLDALMENAKVLVKYVERYGDAAKKKTEQAGGDDVDKEFQSLLHNMGIANPVTRAAAGSLYHEELSRQLADFLAASEGAGAGMIPMTDLFCLFNRARGTALVSPDDLVQACQMFERLGLGFRLRRFASGVLVVQSSNFSDEAMAARLVEMLSQGSGGAALSYLTAIDAAEKLSVSLSLALEHLQTAESMGKLCRDETPNGVRFYANLLLCA